MTSKFLVPKVKYDSCCSDSSSEFISPMPGRKRKLDHLSYEEKVQRKKLKNRVAAQTSRDRKKKQMEEMQDTIEQQAVQIAGLERRCDQLSNERDKILAKYEKLEKDYQKMKSRTGGHKPQPDNNIPEEHKYTRSAFDDTNVESSVGSFTIKTEGSAEGNKNGNRVNKALSKSPKSIEGRSEGVAESHHALPTLQELLQDIEFDQFDLEQLAESLLEDVSSNLETNVAPSCVADAKIKSRKQPLPKRVVGTDDEAMESAEDSRLKADVTLAAATQFYETYKNKIIYADEIPVEEECLEIDSTPEICLKLKREPIEDLISPIPSYIDEHLKSPVHTISDGGYESHGSPLSLEDFSLREQQDDLNYLLNDLFPALA